MELQTILIIISALLTVLATVFGGGLKKAKDKLKALVTLFKEIWELVGKLSAALEDNTVTPEEVTELRKEANDVKLAFKALIGKAPEDV